MLTQMLVIVIHMFIIGMKSQMLGMKHQMFQMKNQMIVEESLTFVIVLWSPMLVFQIEIQPYPFTHIQIETQTHL